MMAIAVLPAGRAQVGEIHLVKHHGVGTQRLALLGAQRAHALVVDQARGGRLGAARAQRRHHRPVGQRHARARRRTSPTQRAPGRHTPRHGLGPLARVAQWA